MDPAATSLTLLCLCSVGLCRTASATPIQVRRTFLRTFWVSAAWVEFSVAVFYGRQPGKQSVMVSNRLA